MDARWTDAIIILLMALLATWISSQFGQLEGRNIEAFVASAYFYMAALALIIMVGAAQHFAFFSFLGFGDTKKALPLVLVGAAAGFLITREGKLIISKLINTSPGAIDPTLGFLFVVVLAPFVEEYLFRGALFPSFQKFLAGRSPGIVATAAAALISSGLFALWHVVASGGNFAVLQGEVIFSLLAVGLTVFSNSLAPAIGMHFMRNVILG